MVVLKAVAAFVIPITIVAVMVPLLPPWFLLTLVAAFCLVLAALGGGLS